MLSRKKELLMIWTGDVLSLTSSRSLKKSEISAIIRVKFCQIKVAIPNATSGQIGVSSLFDFI